MSTKPTSTQGSLLGGLAPPAAPVVQPPPSPAVQTPVPASGPATPPWDLAGRPRSDATTPDPGWSSKLKVVADLSFLPEAVRVQVQRAIDEGIVVGTWQADGKPYAMVFGIKGGHLQAFQDELLASGWGRYSPPVLVWGWSQ